MVRLMDRLSERGRLAVLLARQEAGNAEAPAVGALHLVAGLIREDEGMAAELLTHHGVRLEDVRELAGAGAGERFVPASVEGEIPLSPTVERALERAAEESRWLGLEHASTEHVLLGLLHEGSGAAIRLLLDAGLSEAALHEQVVRRARRRR